MTTRSGDAWDSILEHCLAARTQSTLSSVILHAPHHLHDCLFREPWSACILQGALLHTRYPHTPNNGTAPDPSESCTKAIGGVTTTVPPVALMTAKRKQLRTPPCIGRALFVEVLLLSFRAVWPQFPPATFFRPCILADLCWPSID
jgi:hypothetical protein